MLHPILHATPFSRTGWRWFFGLDWCAARGAVRCRLSVACLLQRPNVPLHPWSPPTCGVGLILCDHLFCTVLLPPLYKAATIGIFAETTKHIVGALSCILASLLALEPPCSRTARMERIWLCGMFCEIGVLHLILPGIRRVCDMIVSSLDNGGRSPSQYEEKPFLHEIIANGRNRQGNSKQFPFTFSPSILQCESFNVWQDVISKGLS